MEKIKSEQTKLSKKKVKFKFINPNSVEYPKELMLRWEVLRKPLGMSPGSEINSKKEEEESLHLIALDGKEVVGCVLFHPEKEKEGKLFQMAVSEEYRGRGFGRKLIIALEKELKSRHFDAIYLQVREEVLKFYIKMGYAPDEAIEMKLGIPHRTVRKKLLSQKFNLDYFYSK